MKETFEQYNVEGNGDFSDYPFPSDNDKKYIGIIKSKPSANVIVDIANTYTENDYDNDVPVIEELYHENDGNETYESFKDFITQSRAGALVKGAKSNLPGAYFWNTTRKLGIIMGKHGGIVKGMLSKTGLKWNTVMRTLKYSGVSDFWKGLIHSNEPCQAVFFSIKDIEVIDIIPNINEFPFEPTNELYKHFDLENYNMKEKNIVHKILNNNEKKLKWLSNQGMIPFHINSSESVLTLIINNDTVIKNKTIDLNIPKLEVHFENTTLFNSEIDSSTSNFDDCKILGTTMIYANVIINSTINESNVSTVYKIDESTISDSELSNIKSLMSSKIYDSTILRSEIYDITIENSKLASCKTFSNNKLDIIAAMEVEFNAENISSLKFANTCKFMNCTNKDETTELKSCTFIYKSLNIIKEKMINFKGKSDGNLQWYVLGPQIVKDEKGIVSPLSPSVVAKFILDEYEEFPERYPYQTAEELNKVLYEYEKSII